jgi:hypothetical protein
MLLTANSKRQKEEEEAAKRAAIRWRDPLPTVVRFVMVSPIGCCSLWHHLIANRSFRQLHSQTGHLSRMTAMMKVMQSGIEKIHW